MNTLGPLRNSVLLLVTLGCLFLSASSTAFGKEIDNENDCVLAGGHWQLSQTGQWGCVGLPPGSTTQPGGGGLPSNIPPPPANLVLQLRGPARLAGNHDISKAITLEVGNTGGQVAPRGFHVSLGLYGQDPPTLKFELKTITSNYGVAPGRTLTLSNFGPVVIHGSAAGPFNFCASLENQPPSSCYSVTVVVLGQPTPPSSINK